MSNETIQNRVLGVVRYEYYLLECGMIMRTFVGALSKAYDRH